MAYPGTPHFRSTQPHVAEGNSFSSAASRNIASMLVRVSVSSISVTGFVNYDFGRRHSHNTGTGTSPPPFKSVVVQRSVAAPGVAFGRRAMLLFLTKGIGTPRFGLVEHVNAFVNESEVGIHFVDFG